MILDLEGLARLPTRTEPYEHLVMADFIKRDHQAAVLADFPAIADAGLYTPDEVKITGQFAQTMTELMGLEFEKAMSRAFGLDLSKYPKVYTVRGHTRAKDGNIHTDSTTKVVTVLLYFNVNPWPQESGKLRILRSPSDLNDYSEEVPPSGGMLLAFKRSDKSWHGHPPFEGQRRAIQLNWVTSDWVVKKDELRHKLSAKIKALRRAAR
jgi:SM-20-related protein